MSLSRDEIEAGLDRLAERKQRLRQKFCFGEEGERMKDLDIAAVEIAEGAARRMLERLDVPRPRS